MNSMTGYGYKEEIIDDTQVSVEIRSVNSRFLDLNVSLPPFLNALESRIRKEISDSITRGKVDVYIRVKDLKSNAEISVDYSLAEKYADILSNISDMFGSNHVQTDYAVADAFIALCSEKPDQKYFSKNHDFSESERTAFTTFVASQEGVINVNKSIDPENYWPKVEKVLQEVLQVYNADRKREGENLKKDLLVKLSTLDECASFFEQWQPKMEEKFKEQITARFNELLGDNVDQNRILSETAAMLVKYTINEEIIRLKSHLEALRHEMLENPLPGKRMDFICQEANREINTIGSKNQFTEVGAMVVTAKDALENIREQSKNVE